MTWTGGELTAHRRTYGRNVILHSGVGSGTHTLTRTTTYTDGRVVTVPVAGGVSVPGAGSDVWVDGDAPFGASVVSNAYRFAASTVVVPSEDRKWAVLSDPMTGISVNITGTELGPKTWASATTLTWLNVTAGDDPSIYARPEQAPIQGFEFQTHSRVARETVARLAELRRPLCVRSPEAGMDDTWFSLVNERVEDRRLSKFADDERRVHTWDMHTITRPNPATTRHALHNLGELAAHGATLGDLAAQWPTLGDIALASLTLEDTGGLPW